MSAITFPRTAPSSWGARWQTLRQGLFSSPINAIVTLAVVTVLVWIAFHLGRWALVNATWSGTAQDCALNSGACWAFVRANLKLMFFATYPSELLWRPIASLILMFGLIGASMMPRFWGRALVVAWVATPILVCLLLDGSLFGRRISTNDWGGLPLTMLIWTISYAAAFVIAIPLALARRSNMGGIKTLAIAIIEIVRGTPMLVVLLVSSLIVPMALPYFEVNLFFSVQVALVIFVGCYLAEVIRAGIQALPAGQIEAARSLGLSYWHTTWLVVLPQALRAVIPALVNLGIGVLLSTPLITGIGMIDFLSAVRFAASDELNWPARYNEAYVFAALVYFAICFPTSRYSLWLERRLKASNGHQPQKKEA
jgi:general L-amino acid transport system permease protein